MAAWQKAQHKSTDVTAPLGTRACCRQTQLAYHVKPSAGRPGTQALIGHGYACGQEHSLHISAANAPPASQTTGILSGGPHRHPRCTTSVVRTHHFIRCHSLAAPHPRMPAPVQLWDDRLGGQHSGARSESRTAAGLHLLRPGHGALQQGLTQRHHACDASSPAAQAQPWYCSMVPTPPRRGTLASTPSQVSAMYARLPPAPTD
jgi:hypothetical protein